MSTRAILNSGAKLAFRAAGDVIRDVILYERVVGDYDPETGTRAVTETQHAIQATIGKVSKSRTSGESIHVNDDTVTIIQSELGFTPDENTQVNINGLRFKVVSIGEDTACVLWQLVVRIAT
jgi:Mg2+/Co2+ transporter CorC